MIFQTIISKLSNRRALWIAALLTAGFLLRLGYAAYVYTNAKPEMSREQALNTDGYDYIALTLARHGEFGCRRGEPTAEREPFYPLLLAALHLVFGGSPLIALMLNLAAGMLSCWLIYLLTDRIFSDSNVSLIALAAACFYPEWIYYGAFIYREPLLIMLICLWTWLWVSRREESSPLPYALMGLVFAAISLTRSPMTPLGAVFVLIAARRIPARRWLKTIGTFLLCSLLALTPWIVRNYLLLGRFVYGASLGGLTIYLSLLKDYDRPEIPLEQPLMDGTDEVIREITARKLTISEAEPLYYRAAWKIFTAQPALFWKAFARKVIKLWRPYPNVGWDYGHSLGMLRITGLISNGSIMLLGALGAFLALRRRFDVGFLLAVPAAMTFIYGIFWAVTRYHSPLMAGLIPPAAFAACKLFPRSR